jgi:hypothetical protein
MPKDEERSAEKLRGKHRDFAKKIRDDVKAELGDYADGGPAVAIARPEWDGMTKAIDSRDNATDEELGEITSIVLHIKPD